jgi:hypothetical protein
MRRTHQAVNTAQGLPRELCPAHGAGWVKLALQKGRSSRSDVPMRLTQQTDGRV